MDDVQKRRVVIKCWRFEGQKDKCILCFGLCCICCCLTVCLIWIKKGAWTSQCTSPHHLPFQLPDQCRSWHHETYQSFVPVCDSSSQTIDILRFLKCFLSLSKQLLGEHIYLFIIYFIIHLLCFLQSFFAPYSRRCTVREQSVMEYTTA